MRQEEVRCNKVRQLPAGQEGHAMVINIIILIVVVCIAWFVWTERKEQTGVRQRLVGPGVA